MQGAPWASLPPLPPCTAPCFGLCGMDVMLGLGCSVGDLRSFSFAPPSYPPPPHPPFTPPHRVGASMVCGFAYSRMLAGLPPLRRAARGRVPGPRWCRDLLCGTVVGPLHHLQGVVAKTTSPACHRTPPHTSPRHTTPHLTSPPPAAAVPLALVSGVRPLRVVQWRSGEGDVRDTRGAMRSCPALSLDTC